MAIVVMVPLTLGGQEGALNACGGFIATAVTDADRDWVGFLRLRDGAGCGEVFLFEWDLDWGRRRIFKVSGGITFPVEALVSVMVDFSVEAFVDPELSHVFGRSPVPKVFKIIQITNHLSRFLEGT